MKMKNFVVSLVALFAATSAFASEPLAINLNNVSTKTVTKKTEGPAFGPQTFASLPVVKNNGQAFGLDLAVLIEKHEEKVALLRPLGKYTVAGVNLQTVASASVSTNGKKLNGGLGVLAEVGEVTPGVDVALGVVAPVVELANGSIRSNDWSPVLRTRIEPNTVVRNVVSVPLKVEKTARRVVIKLVNDINHAL